MNPSTVPIATLPRLASSTPRRRTSHDLYLALLGVSLVGYATLGKGFAYLGVPPLFIGEILLALGLITLARSGCWIAVLTSGPSLLILLLLVWVIMRTVPYLSVHGLDAPRDSMIVVYGLFAFIVVALLIEQPSRLHRLLDGYSRLAWFYGPAGGVIYHLTNPGVLTVSLPIQLPMVRAGEAAVHIAGAAVFALLGLRRVSAMWWLLVLASVVMVVPSRAAMLTCLLPMLLGAALGGKLARVVPGLMAALGLLALAWAADIDIKTPGGRDVGPAQIVENFGSILGRSEASNLDGTKLWRLRWWETIRGYTVHGDLFWTGRGFGVNLAESDGFMLEGGKAMLRSPHNGHMTMLARGGVPGFVLWIAMCGGWTLYLLAASLRARRLDKGGWASLFVWLICYAVGMLVNASFDVALEGPMLGIWFWCIIGLGIAAVMIFNAEANRHRAAT